MKTPKDDTAMAFILGEAGEAVTTFFAPVVGMYNAVLSAADPDFSSDKRRPGRSLERLQRHRKLNTRT